MSIYVNAQRYPQTDNDTYLEWFDYYVTGYSTALQNDMGDYADNYEDGTIFGQLNKVGERTTGKVVCYPRYKSGYTLKAYAAAWYYGANVDIMGNATTLDNAAAVNAGGGLVTIPITGHKYFPGEHVTISGSVNYNGTYTIDETAQVGVNSINIPADYVAEVFTGAEKITACMINKFTIEGIHVSDISSNGYYEIILYQGLRAFTYWVEIARIPFFKTAAHAGEMVIPVNTGWQVTEREISAVLMSSTGVADTCKVKLLLREFEGTGW